MVVHQQMVRPDEFLFPISAKPSVRADISEGLHHDIENVLQLLELSQRLPTLTGNQVSYLCEEIVRITQNRAHLYFDNHQIREHSSPFPESTMLPVQFGGVVYGLLYVYTDQYCYPLPALARPAAQLLAQLCGLILHLLEQSAFLHVQYEHLNYHISGPLTRREREVLELMYKGYTEEEIADELSISPTTVNKHRQNIYGQLGVHNEYDARLVAYHMRMFPIIEKHKLSRLKAFLNS